MKLLNRPFAPGEVAVDMLHLLRLSGPGKVILSFDASRSVSDHVALVPSLLGMDSLFTVRRWRLTRTVYTYPIVGDMAADRFETVSCLLDMLMAAGARSLETALRMTLQDGVVKNPGR